MIKRPVLAPACFLLLVAGAVGRSEAQAVRRAAVQRIVLPVNSYKDSHGYSDVFGTAWTISGWLGSRIVVMQLKTTASVHSRDVIRRRALSVDIAAGRCRWLAPLSRALARHHASLECVPLTQRADTVLAFEPAYSNYSSPDLPEGPDTLAIRVRDGRIMRRIRGKAMADAMQMDDYDYRRVWIGRHKLALVVEGMTDKPGWWGTLYSVDSRGGIRRIRDIVFPRAVGYFVGYSGENAGEVSVLTDGMAITQPVAGHPGSIDVWRSVGTSWNRWTHARVKRASQKAPLDAQVSPNGRLLAVSVAGPVSYLGARVSIYDVASGARVYSMALHDSDGRIAWSKDSRSVAIETGKVDSLTIIRLVPQKKHIGHP